MAAIADTDLLRFGIDVDDPASVVAGPPASVAVEVALALLWSSFLGSPLVWTKAGGSS